MNQHRRMQEQVELLARCSGQREVRDLVTLSLATWLAGFPADAREGLVGTMAAAAFRLSSTLDRIVGPEELH